MMSPFQQGNAADGVDGSSQPAPVVIHMTSEEKDKTLMRGIKYVNGDDPVAMTATAHQAVPDEGTRSDLLIAAAISLQKSIATLNKKHETLPQQLEKTDKRIFALSQQHEDLQKSLDASVGKESLEGMLVDGVQLKTLIEKTVMKVLIARDAKGKKQT